jgi:hypothetical protein
MEAEGNDATHYISEGVVTVRPAMGASLNATTVVANGTAYVTLTGVPSGAAIYIDQASAGTADGSAIELTFDTPGVYRITAVKWPSLDFEGVVDAT